MFCQALLLERLTQASMVTPAVAFKALEWGTLTMSLTPSKETAVFASAVSTPVCPSVTPFW